MPQEPADPGGAGPGGAAGPAAPEGAAELRALAGLLRAAGLDPSAEELADALWLAGRTRIAAAGAAGAGPASGSAAPEEPPGPPGPSSAAEPAAEPPAEPEREEPEVEDPVRLYPAGQRPAPDTGAAAGIPVAGAVPVRVPGAAALPRILEIQRALRALQRHRPPGRPTRTVLDEAATVEASARALGLVIPVFRPESRREATVRLVMDASPSMAVWQEMFEELRAVCERLGAFRDVQAHHLHRLADGTAAVGRGPAPGPGLRSGDQLRDPTGRALTIVVSDCAGPVWREGEAQRLLHRWAECAPCAVVQPLPQRLWSRSWLPTERGVLERAATAGGPGTGGAGPGGGPRLRFRPERPPRPGRPTGGLTVPVLPPNATALGAWARLVAGLGTGPVPAEVGRVLARHPAAPVPLPPTGRPPHELVRRFRSSAAPGAVQLAVYLSAAPLTLPVMRLVQRTMLPDSEPSDLAEVLLGGLLRRSGETPGQWYEFVPGVQEVLLGPLGRDEAALVLKHCSEYVRAHFGRGVRNFPALAVAQLTGEPADAGPDADADADLDADPATAPATGPDAAPEGGRVPPGRLPQAFAQVSAKVVRRYLPGPPEEIPAPPPAPVAVADPPAGRARALRAARERLAARTADADAGPLYEAAALLRRAVAAPPGAGDPPEEAETELAGVLLRLWAVQRDPELLGEAERAATGLRTAAGRAALGRVLYERAVAAGPAPELLTAADREFAAAGAAAAGPELRRDCGVRRARTLIRLSALRDDAGPLREARAALEPLASGSGAADPELLLALGRVLVALLPRTPDPAERTALAEQAATILTTALTTLLPPPPSPGPGRDPAGGSAPVAGGAGGPAAGADRSGPAEARAAGPAAGSEPGSAVQPVPGGGVGPGPAAGSGSASGSGPGPDTDGGAGPGGPYRAAGTAASGSGSDPGPGPTAPAGPASGSGGGPGSGSGPAAAAGRASGAVSGRVPDEAPGSDAGPGASAGSGHDPAPASGSGAEGFPDPASGSGPTAPAGPASGSGGGPGSGSGPAAAAGRASGAVSDRVPDQASRSGGLGASGAGSGHGPAPASGPGAEGASDRASGSGPVAGVPGAEVPATPPPDHGSVPTAGPGPGAVSGFAAGPETGSGPGARAGSAAGAGPGSGSAAGSGAGAPPGGGFGGPAWGPVRPAGAARRRLVVRVRVELAGALRYLPARLDEAAGQLARALEEATGESGLRLAALLGLARVHQARYARDADPAALEEAAEAYGRARRLIPRDGEAFRELLPEWGDVLLDRARAADGRPFASTAVRVLRESRAAVPQSDPGAAYRLMRLATGLRLRHAYEGDLVDLREAEYLLELAGRQGHLPLERARAWREHGDVQQEIHAHTRTADRLDRAADSYRRAWRAALEADQAPRDADRAARDARPALQLAARVQELRGEVLERLARPRAALDAYRAALELWQRQGLPDGERARAVLDRMRALEAGP